MMLIKIKKTDYVDNRIDMVIPLLNKEYSRSQIQKLIKEKKIKVNNKEIKSSYLLKLNDEITIDDNKIDTSIKGEDIPFNIIYEDDDVIVIDKPRGLVVHPGNGNLEHTLVNALVFKNKKLSSIDPNRPGIVHRIDKDTSGLLLIAKNNDSHRELVKQLEKHMMHREYQALVLGIINEDNGVIIAPIGRDKQSKIKMAVDIKSGKEAETSFKVLERYSNATLVECHLKQGRTHQIRVHFNYIKHPLIGDLTYGRNNRNIIKDGQILHAYKISFIHPKTKKKMSFTSPLPEYFIEAKNRYKNLGN